MLAAVNAALVARTWTLTAISPSPSWSTVAETGDGSPWVPEMLSIMASMISGMW